MADIPKIPDLPAVGLDPMQLDLFLQAVREVIQTREGRRGNYLDRAITVRDLLEIGLATRTATDRLEGAVGSGAPGATGPAGPAGPPGTPYVPDYTAPPTPAGLNAVSLFRGALIEWTAPTYTVGHGNAYTKVYVAQYGGSGALPTFAAAVVAGQVGGASSMFVHDAAMGAALHIWLAFMTADGVESVTPAGGLNGFALTVGKVGNSDLGPLIVEAANLANASVTTEKQAVTGRGAALNADPAFQDTSAWALFAGNVGAFVTITDGAAGTTALRSGTPGATGSWYNGRDRIALDPDKTYRVRCLVRKSAAATDGQLFMGVALFDAAGANIAGDGSQWFYAASGIPAISLGSTTFAPFTGQFGFGTAKPFPANARTMVPLVILNYAGTTGYMEAQYLRITEMVMADHMAANSIAVGTLAVQDAALVRAMIGLLQVDDARMASVSVAKLLAGVLQVGAYIRSTNYDPGVAGFELGSDGVLRAIGADFSGTVKALAGELWSLLVKGDLTIAAGGSLRGGQTGYATGTGFWAGKDGADYKVSIGSPGAMMTWNGFALSVPAATVTGQLTTTQILVGAASAMQASSVVYSGTALNWSVGVPASSKTGEVMSQAISSSGAQVIFRGELVLSAQDSIPATVAQISMSVDARIDGLGVFPPTGGYPQGASLFGTINLPRMAKSGAYSGLQAILPFTYTGAPASGSHTYSVAATVRFYDSAGILVSVNQKIVVDAFVIFTVFENKV